MLYVKDMEAHKGLCSKFWNEGATNGLLKIPVWMSSLTASIARLMYFLVVFGQTKYCQEQVSLDK